MSQYRNSQSNPQRQLRAIVGTPADALRCFIGTDIDCLAFGNCFLRKEEQNPALRCAGYQGSFE